MDSKEFDFCRVCGLKLSPPAWGNDGKTSSHDICECCGVEFGYEDSSIVGIRKYRQDWFLSGAIWFMPEFKPEGWDLNQQLQNIPKEFL